MVGVGSLQIPRVKENTWCHLMLLKCPLASPEACFGGVGKHFDGVTIENNGYFYNATISCHSNRVTVRALSPLSVCQLRFSVPPATSELLLLFF